MSKPRGGLGRGLGALIPTAPAGTPATGTKATSPAAPAQPAKAAVAVAEPPAAQVPAQEVPAEESKGRAAAKTPASERRRPETDKTEPRTTGASDSGGAGPVGVSLEEAVPDSPAPAAPVKDTATPAPPERALTADSFADGGPAERAPAVASTPDRWEPEPQLAPVPGARFAEIPVDAILPNSKQPRSVFDEEALEELKVSIEEVGFLQPIVVREAEDGSYELVMGERRWRAAQALGREKIPAIVRDTRDDAMLRDALLENIHRANLNPLEEAAAYQQLLEEFGATHEDLARRIGRSRPQISNTIRLLNLPAPVQRRVAAGVLSAGHARALLSLEDPELQESLAHRIIAEGLSVRATEEAVAVAVADGSAAKKPAPRRAKPHAPGLTDLAERLSDRFDTRVKVDIGRRKGRIVIEFATVDDLERIVGMIGIEGKERPING